MIELNIKDLPLYPQGVVLTGEVGVQYIDGKWERDGQKLLCPLSYLVAKYQPQTSSWLSAVCQVTGWTQVRVLTFKLTMGRAHGLITAKSQEAKKGATDAALYDLLYQFSRKSHGTR